MSNIHAKRLTRVVKELKTKHGALLLSPHPVSYESRDIAFKQTVDRNIYYLCGDDSKVISLLITEDKRFAIMPTVNKHSITWDGRPNIKMQKLKQLGFEIIATDEAEKTIYKLLSGKETLYHQGIKNSLSTRIAQELAARPSFQRAKLPRVLIDCDRLMTPLRLVKDKEELALIRQAIKITNAAIDYALTTIRRDTTEIQLANIIDSSFRLLGAEPAFNTIIASAGAAATLHHTPSERLIKHGSYLLIDCGARLGYYCSDISRTVCIGEEPKDKRLLTLHKIVAEAQNAAIKQLRPGKLFSEANKAAIKVITTGLIDIGLLKGSLTKNISKKAYKKFFMHSIGHSIGLDVHDLSDIREGGDLKLEKNMVFTAEPGIYITEKAKGIPPVGIRIEDTIIV